MIQTQTFESAETVLAAYPDAEFLCPATQNPHNSKDREGAVWLVDFGPDEDALWAVLDRFGWLSWTDDHGIVWEAETP